LAEEGKASCGGEGLPYGLQGHARHERLQDPATFRGRGTGLVVDEGHDVGEVGGEGCAGEVDGGDFVLDTHGFGERYFCVGDSDPGEV